MEHKILAKCLGGSHLYGLNTPASDEDIRFIYINTDIDKIIGLNHNSESHWQDKSDGKDIEGKEVRHAFQLLKRGNSQIIELLFNENWIIITPEWQKIISHRKELIDSEILFKSLMGYMQGERKLAFGEISGRLGSKRKDCIAKNGFSEKNVVQLIRLAECGSQYFRTGIFPTNLKTKQPGIVYDNLWRFLLNIKIHPEDFKKDYLLNLTLSYEEKLKYHFDNRKINTKFNEDLANNLILDLYKPYLNT